MAKQAKHPQAALVRIPTASPRSRRTFLLAGSALLASGCFGSFGATNALYDFNKDVSSNKWLRWLVFLAFVILPVYQLFILADALVLNTIEFFTGKNPVGGATLANGQRLVTSATADENVVKHELFDEDGERVRTSYVRRLDDMHMQWLDEQMRTIGGLRRLQDGSVEVLDSDGNVRSTVPAEQVQEVSTAVEQGESPSRAVASALQLRKPADTRLAELRP